MTATECISTTHYNKESSKKHTVFFLYLAVMLMALFARNALNVNIPAVFYLMITLIPLIIGNTDDILAVAVCCIPFSSGFQYKYALLLGIAAFLWKSRGKIRLTSVMGVVACMMIWELFHGFYGSFSFVEYFRSFAELLFLAVVSSCIDRESLNYKFILRAYSVAVVGVCFVMLYLQLSQNNFDLNEVLTRGTDSRFGENNTDYLQYGLNFNPNALGFICNLSLASCLFLISRKENSAFDIVLLVLSAIFAFMTLARSAVICMLFFVLGYVLFAPIKGTKKLQYVIVTIVLLLVIFTLIYFFMPVVFDNIVDRFSEDDVSNGRNRMFAFYNEHLNSSPFHLLFGIGLQDFAGKMINIYGGDCENVPHNGYQESIVCWGILGIILVALLIIFMIKETKGTNRRSVVSFLPLLGWMLYITAGQLVTSECALLELVLIFVILSISTKKFDYDRTLMEKKRK